jgi:hypothetical protein
MCPRPDAPYLDAWTQMGTAAAEALEECVEVGVLDAGEVKQRRARITTARHANASRLLTMAAPLALRLAGSENGRMPDEMDEVVRGVGQVCISASSLEWSLAYCTSVLRRMG